ncbi:MAG: hypothetical protein ABIQ53_01020 [Terracoccus sp.]
MGHVIAFIPASGGVGASTLAAAVAVRAAGAGRAAVAVDLDHVAGRLDVVFGVEQHPGWRWDALAEVIGVVDGAALAQRLPCSQGVRVLAHDRRPALAAAEDASLLADSAGRGDPAQPEDHGGVFEVVADVVSGLARAHEVTVLDLPRDEAVLEAVAGLVDVVVLVVGSALSQVAAASASSAVLKAALRDLPMTSTSKAWSCAPPQIWIVLRGTAVSEDLADVVVDHLDLPLAGSVGDEPRIVSDLERGIVPGARGRGSLVDVADDLLLRLLAQERAA